MSVQSDALHTSILWLLLLLRSREMTSPYTPPTPPIIPAPTPAAATPGVMEPVVHTVGSLACILFFVSDFFIAYTLNVLKRAHPAIDDAAPDDEDASTAGVTIEVGASSGSGRRFGQGASAFAGQDMFHLLAQTVTGTPSVTGRRQRVHIAVIMCAVAAPFFCLLQILAPASMSWSLFHVPSWLAYLVIVPGLGLSIVYALRAHRVSQIGDDFSKSQWLQVMWFRLDVIVAFAAVLLLAWGDWLVSGCLITVDIYLAQRLLATERKLVHAVRGTQLLPDEYGSRDELSAGVADHGATAHVVPRTKVVIQ